MKPKRKQRRNRDSALLNRWRLGEPVNPEDAQGAASRLGRRLVEVRGLDYMSSLAVLGARAYWAAFTPAERALEMKRRAAKRQSNRRFQIAKRIAGLTGK